MTKQWMHHARPTAEGERELASRLADESGLPHETAQLFATARISNADLEAVVRAAGLRYVMDMPDYDYHAFHMQWPAEFPHTNLFPRREDVGAKFGDILLAAVRQNLKNQPELSWGQLISRAKLLYGKKADGQPFDRFADIATAVSDTITWFDFDGARGTATEQHRLQTQLAKQGELIATKLQPLAQGNAPIAEETIETREVNKDDPTIQLRLMARRIYGMIREGQAVQQGTMQPLQAETVEQLDTIYQRIQQLISVFGYQAQFRDRAQSEKQAYYRELRSLPQKIEDTLTPPPTPKKDLLQKLGLKKVAARPMVRPQFGEEPEPFFEEPDTSKPFPKIAAETPQHRPPSVVFGQAGRLARDLARFNSAGHVTACEQGAAYEHQYRYCTFAADRILSGHNVSEDFVGQNKRKPKHESSMRGAYCLAGAMKPFAQMKAKGGDDELAVMAKNVIRDARHYAPGKATNSRAPG